MAVSNIHFKITERSVRIEGEANKADHVTQPRLLQPIDDADSLTSANGFTPANLITGDQIFCDESSTDSGVSSICYRNSANDGWVELVLLSTDDVSDLHRVVNALSD